MAKLYIFVEGSDDERFFKSYYDPAKIKIIPYANMPTKDITNYLKSIQSMNNSDYLFFADADGASIDDKTEIISKKYPLCEREKIRIVQWEIESWYLAGLDSLNCAKYKIKYLPHTNDVSKEKFISMLPKGHTRVTFQIEILKCFNQEEAKNRNYSFRVFAK